MQMERNNERESEQKLNGNRKKKWRKCLQEHKWIKGKENEM